MKKYISFFRLRFTMGLQYRAAALAGVATQFVWGFMYIMMYHAFYEGDAASFPMSFSATASYIWLQQSFFCMFATWMMENEIFDSIVNGNISYELCRPVNIYDMWFSRSVANRLSRAALRCFPILAFSLFLPQPYGLSAPAGFTNFFLFLLTMMLGLGVTVSFCTLIYILAFFTISPQGLRVLFLAAVDLFAGAIIPLPFFPKQLEDLLELLPFASMQNVPFRIYSGHLSGGAMQKAIILQIFWLLIVTLTGKYLYRLAVKRVTLLGG